MKVSYVFYELFSSSEFAYCSVFIQIQVILRHAEVFFWGNSISSIIHLKTCHPLDVIWLTSSNRQNKLIWKGDLHSEHYTFDVYLHTWTVFTVNPTWVYLGTKGTTRTPPSSASKRAPTWHVSWIIKIPSGTASGSGLESGWPRQEGYQSW